MVFAGFFSLFDSSKACIPETIAKLNGLGIALKVITGDDVLLTKSMAAKVGLNNSVILSGKNFKNMSAEALRYNVLKTDVFAEVKLIQNN